MDATRRCLLAGAGLVGVNELAKAAQEGMDAGQDEPEPAFRLVPIGRVEKEGDAARVRVFDRYAEGLLGLDGWSHVNVLYWFDRNDDPRRRAVLRVHPRGDATNPLTGVFACRAPVRPNLIALSVCRVLSVEGGVVTVDSIDAFDGTPVVDLKPLIPPDVKVEDLRVPEWARRGR